MVQEKLIRKVKQTIKKYDMIRPHEKIVVAVSGGPDSICLLDMLHGLAEPLQAQLVVAHFDHGLRPGEDQEETRFVERIAQGYGLPIHTGKAEPMPSKGSVEEHARKQRYRFLEEVRRQHQAHKIAMGHQLNDQAETVLMRLLRGSGLSGLGGIPPKRDHIIIRPLIETTREEIMAYLWAKGLTWVQDSSNLSTTYLRNKIRLELIPLLKTYQPNIIETLGRNAEIYRQEDAWFQAEARDWLMEHARFGPNGQITTSIFHLSTLPAPFQRRVLREMIRTAAGGLRRVSLDHIRLASELAKSPSAQAEIMLPRGLVIKKRYDHLIVEPRRILLGDYAYTLEGPGSHFLGAINSTISVQEGSRGQDLELGRSCWEAYLDADKITYPLMVRNFRPGDRLIPLGMRGHKKVHDLFVDLKIPLEIRAVLPILVSDNRLVWVAGLRLDDRFKITGQTKRVLCVKLQGEIVRSFNPEGQERSD
ncbi:MAG: tRNA lysidine(34) synthetase TilS [Deltaproteobacteria bacterium]|nr:MAG: tRNA lysidine(34) synthetase TilS [Deltaproteobacteria bacterium]